jgi:hypothetical protein
MQVDDIARGEDRMDDVCELNAEDAAEGAAWHVPAHWPDPTVGTAHRRIVGAAKENVTGTERACSGSSVRPISRKVHDSPVGWLVANEPAGQLDEQHVRVRRLATGLVPQLGEYQRTLLGRKSIHNHAGRRALDESPRGSVLGPTAPRFTRLCSPHLQPGTVRPRSQLAVDNGGGHDIDTTGEHTKQPRRHAACERVGVTTKPETARIME